MFLQPTRGGWYFHIGKRLAWAYSGFFFAGAAHIMSKEDNLIDFGSERSKRIHDINDKRLNEMRDAFEQALPLGGTKKKKARKKPR